jgi:DNA-binding transcriptional LysR family regulator
MMIELRALRQALALAQHGNFGRAAEALGVTQPSLTRGIAALERKLGVTLFDRTRKGVVPTAFGRVLLERGEAIVKAEAGLQRELQMIAGMNAGTLVVAAGPYAAEVSVAEAVARLSLAHPRLRISCFTAPPEQVLREVLAERVDVGVAAALGMEVDARLVVEHLASQQCWFACRPGHPLLGERPPTLARLSEFPVASVALSRAQLAAAFSPPLTDTPDAPLTDFVPQIHVNTLATARRIARSSNTIVTGTAAQLADDILAGHLVKLEHEGPRLQTHYGIVHLRERTLSPSAKAFIEALRAVEAEAHLPDGSAVSAPPVPSRARARSVPVSTPATGATQPMRGR